MGEENNPKQENQTNRTYGAEGTGLLFIILAIIVWIVSAIFAVGSPGDELPGGAIIGGMMAASFMISGSLFFIYGMLRDKLDEFIQ